MIDEPNDLLEDAVIVGFMIIITLLIVAMTFA
jgi:hypothetical protein